MYLARLFWAFVAALLSPCLVHAHFHWLASDEGGKAILFFGESIAERDYHLPEAVEKATVSHVAPGRDAIETNLAIVEEEEFTGRRTEKKVANEGELHSTIVYGIYHGSKLTYYAQHDLSLDESPSGLKLKNASGLRAEVERGKQGGVRVTVLWQGKPLADATVGLYCDEGHEEGSKATDKEGQVFFEEGPVEDGLNGLLVGHKLKDQPGEVDGKSYESESHYLTATFWYEPKKVAAAVPEQKSPEQKPAGIPPLPEPVASFGAAVAGDWLYVYSGHTGTAHDHSRDNLSKHFCRARIDGTTEWQELPMGPPLQGLALVSHGGKLYRIGGMDARNSSGEEDDLHSISSFACFDPATKAWTDLPPLPSGRSSHNAVVMGDVIYVVGGWQLSGDDNGEWHAGAMAFDLADPAAGWQQLAEPPFHRRALAVGHASGQLLALCGMSDDDGPTSEVSIYDPKQKMWTTGPEFPGEPFHGFGLAAWNVNGTVYAGGMKGILYRLSDDLNTWKEAARFETGRFFHQLLPKSENCLLAIAGASPEEGHLASIEEIWLSAED